MRLDRALVELGLAPSRTKAQALIATGEVEILRAGSWQAITQASFTSSDFSRENLRIKEGAVLLKYVSRGGLKLEGALEQLALDVTGWRALDVGLSTGGFADCLLQRGAREVIGLDVGHDQLAEKLRVDSRLRSFEGVNVRALHENKEICALLGNMDLCVVDVSFISLQLVLPALTQVLPMQTRLLALVKPQFEVGAAQLDKNGVVRDTNLFAQVQTQILHQMTKCGFSKEDTRLEYFPSRVRGQDGNQEFFVYSPRS